MGAQLWPRITQVLKCLNNSTVKEQACSLASGQGVDLCTNTWKAFQGAITLSVCEPFRTPRCSLLRHQKHRAPKCTIFAKCLPLLLISRQTYPRPKESSSGKTPPLSSVTPPFLHPFSFSWLSRFQEQKEDDTAWNMELSGKWAIGFLSEGTFPIFFFL